MTSEHLMDMYKSLRDDRRDLFRNDEEGGGIDIIDLKEPGWIGIVYSDSYIRVIRDLVRFPDGKIGTYLRILHTSEAPGSAVLPMLDGRIVLVEHYRHATRSWHLEIPRGFGTDGMTAEENARKEIQEEISAQIASIKKIGAVHPDTGLYSQLVHLFFAELQAIGPTEASEGIRGTVLFTPDRLDEEIRKGKITDGFTLTALAQARIRGHL